MHAPVFWSTTFSLSMSHLSQYLAPVAEVEMLNEFGHRYTQKSSYMYGLFWQSWHTRFDFSYMAR